MIFEFIKIYITFIYKFKYLKISIKDLFNQRLLLSLEITQIIPAKPIKTTTNIKMI
ncbi:hypothetical protein B11476_15730 [Campylobacter coli]|nr:hypothetical protein B11476_15730 [Campylobacter coli]